MRKKNLELIPLNKSSYGLILTIPLSQIYSQLNKID